MNEISPLISKELEFLSEVSSDKICSVEPLTPAHVKSGVIENPRCSPDPNAFESEISAVVLYIKVSVSEYVLRNGAVKMTQLVAPFFVTDSTFTYSCDLVSEIQYCAPFMIPFNDSRSIELLPATTEITRILN